MIGFLSLIVGKAQDTWEQSMQDTGNVHLNGEPSNKEQFKGALAHRNLSFLDVLKVIFLCGQSLT